MVLEVWSFVVEVHNCTCMLTSCMQAREKAQQERWTKTPWGLGFWHWQQQRHGTCEKKIWDLSCLPHRKFNSLWQLIQNSEKDRGCSWSRQQFAVPNNVKSIYEAKVRLCEDRSACVCVCVICTHLARIFYWVLGMWKVQKRSVLLSP